MSTAAAQIRESVRSSSAWFVLSPDQATALADLLDALPATLDFPATVDPWELITTIWARADTLRAALSRQAEPGATP